MKCPKCSATLKIPTNLIGKTVKCRCGHAMKASDPSKPSPASVSSPSLKIKCPKCKRTLGVKSSSAGKAVQCPCSHRFQVPTPKHAAVRQSSSQPTNGSQPTDDFDFASLAAATQGAQATKGPSYLGGGEKPQQQEQQNQATESIGATGKKKLKKNYASGMLSDVSTEFANRDASHASDAKRRKFLLSMSILFTCLLVPPILFVVYRTITAASDGYANWGDRVQDTVVSMKLAMADSKDKAKDLSEITTKRSVGLPKEPTPGKAFEFPKGEEYVTDSDVRIKLENHYPGWVCDKIQLDVTGKIFRATMLYKPPPIQLPPAQDYSVGDKDAALAAVAAVNLQGSPDQATELFREKGFFSGEIECTEVNRLPGKITLRCNVKNIRDIVPARDYPGMNQVISDLTSKSFQVTVQIDDSLTAKERQAAEDPNNQEVDYGDLGDVIVAYNMDPAEQLLGSFTKQLVTLRPDAILN